MSDSLLALASGAMIFLLIWSPMSRLALERDHVLEAGALGDRDRGERHVGVLVADVLDEQQDEDVVLVLAGVHAAAQFVAAGPEGGVEFGFLEGHLYSR